MNPSHDTITAPATPTQTAALAITRISGPDAIAIVNRIWKGKSLLNALSHTAHLGIITDSDHKPLDQAVATIYRAPKSFTGEDSVEITTHGSTYIQRQLLHTLTTEGARIARPGEFTRRAFLNGRLDLTQAEAVADIIAAENRAAHKTAISQLQGRFASRITQLRNQLLELASLLELELDFSEEDVEFASRHKLLQLAEQIYAEVDRLRLSFAAGNAIKNGIPIAIAGPANAGKSSLLNALLGHERAIVSDIPGTTRDTIDDTLMLGDYTLRLTDTAGLRNTTDPIEKIGIQRTHNAIASAKILIFVADITQSFPFQELQSVITPDSSFHPIIILNKTDLPHDKPDLSSLSHLSIPTLSLSAHSSHGIETLHNALLQQCAAITETSGDIIVTNERHHQALAMAAKSLKRLRSELLTDLPGDLIAQTLREILSHLAAITGDIPSTSILSTIFSRFCVGK